MKFWSTALALLCSAGLTACHGASSPYAPQISDSSPATLERPSPPEPLELAIREATKGCTANPASVPGKYIGLFAAGTVAGGTFTSVFGQWSLLAYSKPAAAVSTGRPPAPAPAQRPPFLYSGTYTMTKTKKQGCVLLVVGQALQPLASGTPSNGVAFGAPLVNVKSYQTEAVELGTLSMKLTGLNSAGGRGTATLFTQQLKSYDTATIVMNKRTGVSSP